MIKTLRLSRITTSYICEIHFATEDVVNHSQGRRLRHNALPSLFPEMNFLKEHDYFPTKTSVVVYLILCLFDTYNVLHRMKVMDR